MEHKPLPARERRSILTRRRFQFAGALVIGALLPWSLRGTMLPGELFEASGINTLSANIVAILIAFWMRLSVETYPGIRRSYVILPSALTGHGIVVVWFLLTRFPYDRLALALSFLLHVLWLYLVYIYGERKVTRRIAVVPFGGVERLHGIAGVEWLALKRPRLADTRGCDAIVASRLFLAANTPAVLNAFETQRPNRLEQAFNDACIRQSHHVIVAHDDRQKGFVDRRFLREPAPIGPGGRVTWNSPLVDL